MKLGFWLRWSLRDLRERWLQVIAIATIIALGTGVFSGLGNQWQWRETSYDSSYEQLNMFDLRLTLTGGSYVEGEALRAALAAIDGVDSIETRLVVPTLVDTSKDGETILVQGRIIGVDVVDGGPQVNRININAGRALTAQDAGEAVAVVDYLFARYYDLEPGDPLAIAGGTALDFVGTGQSPEYFQIISSDAGGFLGESSFAVLYMPLTSLQTITGRTNQVNDAVLLLTHDASRDAVRHAVEEIMTQDFARVGFSLTSKEADPVYDLLYTDAATDQDFFDLIALLFLLGAAMASFNLSGRIVEAQRREIGIGMALGFKRSWLAVRPILTGLQIAVFGAVLGLGMGYMFSQVFANFVKDLAPLPHWANSFYIDSYVRALLLGIMIPFVATLYPVWRAVRVPPVDAIKTGYLVAKGGGWASLMQRVPIPGKSFTQMPFRNLLRAPWRTLLTLLGIAVAIVMLVIMAGMLDSFLLTIDQAEIAYLSHNSDRMMVILDSVYPTSPDQVDPLTALILDPTRVSALLQLADEDGEPLFSDGDAGLIMEGELKNGEESIPIAVEMLPFDEAPVWAPSLVEGQLPGGTPGIVISEKAMRDLGLAVGDLITFEHPAREDIFTFRMIESQVEVTGIHNIPLRATSYMNLDQAELMDTEGFVNYLVVNPAGGVTQDNARHALFMQPGVASVQAVADLPTAFEDVISMVTGLLVIIQVVVLVMAALITFNSTSISVDERRREIATLFAFGLRVRTVARMQVLENAAIGCLGTLTGLVLGFGLLHLIFATKIAEMFPEIQFAVEIAPETLVVAGVLGILVSALSPLLSMRKMYRMDIPSTLRVME